MRGLDGLPGPARRAAAAAAGGARRQYRGEQGRRGAGARLPRAVSPRWRRWSPTTSWSTSPRPIRPACATCRARRGWSRILAAIAAVRRRGRPAAAGEDRAGPGRRRARPDGRGLRRAWRRRADRLQHHHRPAGDAAQPASRPRPAGCPASRCSNARPRCCGRCGGCRAGGWCWSASAASPRARRPSEDPRRRLAGAALCRLRLCRAGADPAHQGGARRAAAARRFPGCRRGRWA